MEYPALGEVVDLTELPKLDEKVLLNELKARYAKDKIYTYIGDILVAVNPFRDLGIYGKDASDKYKMSKRASHPPHIYAVADATYQAMMGHSGNDPNNQCILISGESGAGKTESTKLIIRQLIELCKGNTQLEQQILQVNPLLEAFGNAMTLMNDNSSRFGKYIQLKFKHGNVMGAKISEYLLEKSRLVRQSRGEENFHIFYYMLAGLSQEQKQKYSLGPADSYRYLSNGAQCLKKHAERLSMAYEEVVNHMDLVGFNADEQEDLFVILSGVLNLGNVTFEMNDHEAAFVTDKTKVQAAASLLGVEAKDLEEVLTFTETFARGESIRRNYTTEQAEDSRDATAKAIYGRMFGWIVNKINQLLAPKEILGPEAMEIDILDIFGFEHFERNSFEQACINLANEQLHFFFNKHIFFMEQEEYKREGVDWTEIKFVDNQPLLDLFIAKPIGLIALLDEESQFPKATDSTFVQKLNKNLQGNKYFIKSPNAKSDLFTIAHYAGKVEYSASRWLEKNRDTIPAGVLELLQRSKNHLLQLVFKAAFTRTGTLALQNRSSKKRTTRLKKGTPDPVTSKRKLTVGTQFKNSLQVLMERMSVATPHFVRCIKPNNDKLPKAFDDAYVNAQLLYTGMLETTKIRREGYAYRPLFSDFIERYDILLRQPRKDDDKAACLQILQTAGLNGYHLGKTKVFMKLHHIESLAVKLEEISLVAVVIQKVIRGFLGRRYVKKKQAEALQQAERVQQLLHEIEKLGIQGYEGQQKIGEPLPEGYFNEAVYDEPAGDYGFPPPPPPLTEDQITDTTNEETAGTGSDTDDEVLEDEFVPVKTTGMTKYGPAGTKQASMRWFRATQYDKLRQPHGGFAPWFHGIITRRQSEELLRGKQIGCFLVRVGESRFGYSLSFKSENRCRHYMVDQTASGKYVIVGEPKVHKTLNDLVAYHQKHCISNWSGLLTVPCGQAPGECDYQELVDPTTNHSYEGMYFELEPEKPGSSIYSAAKDFPANPNVPEPKVNMFQGRSKGSVGPPLPDRHYSYATALEAERGKMGGRPLPQKPPEEAYLRLIQDQELQQQETGRKRMSTTRSKLPSHK
ncbi:myosin-IIIb isoform X2 [Lingula anatina]|uniref:Myosin-IIIb isoform X2 n=1 Tax=Lingula anatina TaxID=7574 RepID=A0A1S3IA91_LINAN|nr:myosin-IIIb isoform X2 [Lingula anatina]|eukprot:XP_013394776.1 myosin-IIIb isoform X2 [Lingula anatina]